MPIAEALIPEYDQEMEATRRVLERVPEDQFDWQPHEKSMTLGRLASHVAEIPGWAAMSIQEDEYDVAPPGGDPYQPPVVGSATELMKMFEETWSTARDLIASTSDEALMSTWTMKSGGETMFAMPKIGVVRSFILNHVIHHRGQLTVYLRLLGVPLPQTYGPSADEPDM
jgi:uncharacterized damage-inducible protein DinB